MADAGADERYHRFRGAWAAMSERASHGQGLGGDADRLLLALLVASEGTVLRRFYPFTALSRLCFACSPYPFERVQPTCVDFPADGRYRVFDGGPYPPTQDPSVGVETEEPTVAVEEVIRRLVGC